MAAPRTRTPPSRRGAPAPRSSFRTVTRAGAEQPPPARKAAARPTPAGKPAASKPTPAGKPAAKAAARRPPPAKRVAAKRPAPAAKPPAAAPKPAAARAARRATATAPAPPRAELLGEVTCPSGRLAIFDIALAGFLPREALEPALIVVEAPAERPLPVTGVRVGHGRHAACWDHLAIHLRPGEPAARHKLGRAGIDFGRIALIDHGAFDHWQHEDALDGLADVVAHGRDAKLLARALGLPAHPEGFGWVDRPVDEAEARLLDAQRAQAANRWRLTLELRPHSHHHRALTALRASPRGVGALELAGARMLLLDTTWGDGVFPVALEVDHAGAPLRVIVQLALPDGGGRGPTPS